MRQFTFQEVISNIKIGEKYKSEFFTITLESMNELTIEHKDGFNADDSGIYFNILEKVFSKIIKPISFMDALKKNKPIIIKHKLFDEMLKGEICTEDFSIKRCFQDIKENKSIRPNYILVVMSYRLCSEDVAKIIEESQCYLEE